jgi:2-C-methyl-D-erythritol 4-phosphate cytidylyltransferase
VIVAAIIPAAGSGSRFGEDKLSRSLGGRPVLIRAVEAMSRRDEVRDIIVAGPPDQMDAFRERFGAALGFLGATIVEGGRTDRWETVAAALTHVSDDCTHVAVHDAARPCPGGDMLDRLFKAAGSLPAVIPALPVRSTLKEVDTSAGTVIRDNDALADSILGEDSEPGVAVSPVVRTIDRDSLVLVQTPQIVQTPLLRRAYAEAAPGGCTDEASLLEQIGETVHVVEGDPMNIKITVPHDWPLAEAALARGGVRA